MENCSGATRPSWQSKNKFYKTGLWGEKKKKKVLVFNPRKQNPTESSQLWRKRSFIACAGKQCRALPWGMVLKCDGTWCGNNRVLCVVLDHSRPGKKRTTVGPGFCTSEHWKRSRKTQEFLVQHRVLKIYNITFFNVAKGGYNDFKPWPYLCSEGDFGCDHVGCWSDAQLQTAQKALLVQFLTRSVGSVPQTSWWCPGRAGPSAPATRSSCCRCRCYKIKTRKIKVFTLNCVWNDQKKQQRNKQKQQYGMRETRLIIDI